jgi:hypothetical protein
MARNSDRPAGLLSVERCRELLGKEAPEDDEDLLKISEQAYTLASLLMSHVLKQDRFRRKK